VLEHVKAGTRKLMRERLGGHRGVRPRALALVEALGLDAVAARELRCLDEGPGQIAVAVLGVAFALLLAIGPMLAVDAAGIRREVASTRSASSLTTTTHLFE